MNFIKAAAIAISAVIACGAAEAKMPKEVNIVYVKAPFNLQNMVIKDQKLLEKGPTLLPPNITTTCLH